MKDHKAYTERKPHAANSAFQLQALDKERQSIPDPPVTPEDKQKMAIVLKAMGKLHHDLGEHCKELASHIG